MIVDVFIGNWESAYWSANTKGFIKNGKVGEICIGAAVEEDRYNFFDKSDFSYAWRVWIRTPTALSNSERKQKRIKQGSAKTLLGAKRQATKEFNSICQDQYCKQKFQRW